MEIPCKHGFAVALWALLLAACGGSTGAPSSSNNESPPAGDQAAIAAMAQWAGTNPIPERPVVKTATATTRSADMALWRASSGELLFVQSDGIYGYRPSSSTVVKVRALADIRGLAHGPDGALLVAQGGARPGIYRVSGTNGNANEIVAGLGTLPGAVGLVARRDGNIYVIEMLGGSSGSRVLRVSPPPMRAVQELVLDRMWATSSVLSPDGQFLYLGTSAGGIWRLPLNHDGSVGQGANLVSPKSTGSGAGAVDDAGNIYGAGNNSIQVFKSDGTSWGEIPLNEGHLAGISFGDADRKTLYVTAANIGKLMSTFAIHSVRLNVPGLP